MSGAFALSANLLDSHLASTSSFIPYSGFPEEKFRQASISVGVIYSLPGK